MELEEEEGGAPREEHPAELVVDEEGGVINEEPLVYISNERCVHQFHPGCLCKLLETSPSREKSGSSDEWMMYVTGLCPCRCSSGTGNRVAWYAQNYCPFKPSNGVYTYGHVARYLPNKDRVFLKKVRAANNAGNFELYCHLMHEEGFVRDAEIAITTPEMWNTVLEVLPIPAAETGEPAIQMFENVIVSKLAAIKIIVDLRRRIFGVGARFACRECKLYLPLKNMMVHPSCVIGCNESIICMECACTNDNEARTSAMLISSPARYAVVVHHRFMLQENGHVSGACRGCNGRGCWRRLDWQWLNTNNEGAYAIPAFNKLNRRTRIKVGDCRLPEQLALTY